MNEKQNNMMLMGIMHNANHLVMQLNSPDGSTQFKKSQRFLNL